VFKSIFYSGPYFQISGFLDIETNKSAFPPRYFAPLGFVPCADECVSRVVSADFYITAALEDSKNHKF
jgi:hypothetical protein